MSLSRNCKDGLCKRTRPPLNNRSVRSILRDYFESTTTHGLNRIYAARTLFERGFWLAIFLAVMAFLIATVRQLAIKATSNEIITVFQSRYNRDMQFPAITFCNNVGFTKALESEMVARMTSDAGLLNISSRLANLSEHDIYKIGHQKEIFLMTKLNMCHLGQNACNFTKDVLVSSSPLYGNCFTFKAEGRRLQEYELGQVLSLVININQDDYSHVRTRHDSAGSMVMIHHNDELFLSIQPILLAPGTLTNIKLKKRVLTRLPAPYPDRCTTSGSRQASSTRYSVLVCQIACSLFKQLEACGCVSPFYRSALTLVVERTYSTEVNFRAAESAKEMVCILKYNDWHMNRAATCDCPPPCYEEQFVASVSHSVWPALNSAEMILRDIRRSYGNQSAFANWTKSKVYQNILKVQIQFHDLTVEAIEQRAVYSWNDFLSDLGGTVSLWIGASIFSFIELGSFFLDIIFCCVFERRKQKVCEVPEESQGNE